MVFQIGDQQVEYTEDKGDEMVTWQLMSKVLDLSLMAAFKVTTGSVVELLVSGVPVNASTVEISQCNKKWCLPLHVQQ